MAKYTTMTNKIVKFLGQSVSSSGKMNKLHRIKTRKTKTSTSTNTTNHKS